MSRIRRFREQNPHLFDDSDSDQSEENLSESEENVDPGIQKRRSRSAQRKRGSYTQSPSPKPKQMRGNCYICQDVKQNVCFCEKFVCLDHISKAMACSECMKTNFISKK